MWEDGLIGVLDVVAHPERRALRDEVAVADEVRVGCNADETAGDPMGDTSSFVNGGCEVWEFAQCGDGRKRRCGGWHKAAEFGEEVRVDSRVVEDVKERYCELRSILSVSSFRNKSIQTSLTVLPVVSVPAPIKLSASPATREKVFSLASRDAFVASA